ncbi:MAG: type 2 isopentenyl-diphosphate Delta-isomerase [Ignavibacteria bacterium]|jgi:isopentenyl-diphosphate delta-isomerase|nr:type 2 isopentenyl-diphosphate Delta-isomerase [Ignavibacteria bacterium]MCU7501484.1 type 2 isopentenyl-diphosphate Delta-isomerase [Ignavibacteria bacterium]MCU7516000.1 type 2 isopentenyl-diphosphate Delta-isomerase [Ignavibacteria bacterium]
MDNASSGNTPKRKKEHLELCLTEKVAFKNKSNGLERYEFIHNAITALDPEKIDLSREFFGHRISYPFLISCMTGGTSEAENINQQLAVAANELNIPLGVGSQRQALENSHFAESYRVVRKNAPGIPILGNIGAAQLVQMSSLREIEYLVELIEAQAMVIHLNPLQELLQKGGDTNFSGLLEKIEWLSKNISVPVVAKEVGAGISKAAAKSLLEAGVRAIDVAGAGGTSWAGVEILRNKEDENSEFWDWGLPTSYCIREVRPLKDEYDFLLIASGGISSGMEIAKAIALGADMAASARIVLQKLHHEGITGVKELIVGWFDVVKKVMYLTGSARLEELQEQKLIKKEELY